MDGIDALKAIRSFQNVNQGTPIIAVTAYEQSYQLMQQFDDVIVKPVSKDILTKVVVALRP